MFFPVCDSVLRVKRMYEDAMKNDSLRIRRSQFSALSGRGLNLEWISLFTVSVHSLDRVIDQDLGFWIQTRRQINPL